jgi:hypothetical protein
LVSTGAPPTVLVTGTVSVPAADAVAGMNVTEIAQVAPALSVPQLLLALKLVALELLVVAATVPTCSAVVLVLSSVTVCCVDELPGTLLKTRALGVSDRPGSVDPYPVSAALAVELPACTVSVPVRGPAAEGAKTI